MLSIESELESPELEPSNARSAAVFRSDALVEAAVEEASPDVEASVVPSALPPDFVSEAAMAASVLLRSVDPPSPELSPNNRLTDSSCVADTLSLTMSSGDALSSAAMALGDDNTGDLTFESVSSRLDSIGFDEFVELTVLIRF